MYIYGLIASKLFDPLHCDTDFCFYCHCAICCLARRYVLSHWCGMSTRRIFSQLLSRNMRTAYYPLPHFPIRPSLIYLISPENRQFHDLTPHPGRDLFFG